MRFVWSTWHPAVGRKSGALDHGGCAVDGDPDKQVVRHTPAVRQPGRPRTRVQAHHQLLGRVLDSALVERSEEQLRHLLGDGNGRRHREGHPNVHGVPHSPLYQQIVQQERSLERGRRALERMAENRDQDPPPREVGEGVPQALGAGERVVLKPALLKSRRGRQVVLRPQRHREEVGVVRPLVRDDAPPQRVDCCHGLPAKLDAFVCDVAVVQEHVGRRLPAEQHIQFGEPEVERVVSVDQRDVNRVSE